MTGLPDSPTRTSPPPRDATDATSFQIAAALVQWGAEASSLASRGKWAGPQECDEACGQARTQSRVWTEKHGGERRCVVVRAAARMRKCSAAHIRCVGGDTTC